MPLREKCPVCGRENARKALRFARDFSRSGNLVPFQGYNVYVCPDCGMAYAGDIAETMPLSDYYRHMSRYEQDYAVSEKHKLIYGDVVRFLRDSGVSSESSVLDLGCASGGLLNELKARGYSRLYGVEPSEKNCAYAREHYGLEVYHGAIGEPCPQLSGMKFDLIILNAVLEHLIPLSESVFWCMELLSENGKIFISVPDLSKFSMCDDLYQQFSAEHVNYFSAPTLQRMMERHGLYPTAWGGVEQIEGVGFVGDLKGLFGRRGERFVACPDGAATPDTYLKNCETFAKRIRAGLARFPLSDGIYLWGAGTMAATIFQLGFVRDEWVKGVFDSNLNYIGEKAFGHTIRDPRELKGMEPYPVLISSQTAFAPIASRMKEMGLTNEAINIFT